MLVSQILPLLFYLQRLPIALFTAQVTKNDRDVFITQALLFLIRQNNRDRVHRPISPACVRGQNFYHENTDANII